MGRRMTSGADAFGEGCQRRREKRGDIRPDLEADGVACLLGVDTWGVMAKAQGTGQLWDGIIHSDTDISIDLHEESERSLCSSARLELGMA
ncbi:uncharacterized [Tachysurus ichikawai]